ncbi:MAG: stage II sporulation protein M [Candidatus Doudnabacteria bacterium]|nr:stage II sporulation protein M [Candidatus Doudnabacteria bacterium]
MVTILSDYYNDNRKWILLVAKWFLAAMAVGGIAFFIKPNLVDSILGIFQNKYGDQPVRDINFAKEIFLQNSLACLIALVGGIIFGISSVLTVFFNGFIIGFVIMLLVTSLSGNPFHNIEYVVLGLGPHGIFELPAFILASALGLRLGTEWLKSENHGHRWGTLKANAIRVIQSMPLLIIMLLIAAVVEVFVSGSFVESFN